MIVYDGSEGPRPKSFVTDSLPPSYSLLHTCAHTHTQSADLLWVLSIKPEHAIAVIDALAGPKLNIEGMLAELGEARKAMVLLRNFGVLPEEDVEDRRYSADIWNRAQVCTTCA